MLEETGSIPVKLFQYYICGLHSPLCHLILSSHHACNIGRWFSSMRKNAITCAILMWINHTIYKYVYSFFQNNSIRIGLNEIFQSDLPMSSFGVPILMPGISRFSRMNWPASFMANLYFMFIMPPCRWAGSWNRKSRKIFIAWKLFGAAVHDKCDEA